MDICLAMGSAPTINSPGRELFCLAKLFFLRCGSSASAVITSQLILVKYLYAFYWRNVGVPNDDFFSFFLNVYNPMMIWLLAVVGTFISDPREVPNYGACLGIPLSTYGEGKDVFMLLMLTIPLFLHCSLALLACCIEQRDSSSTESLVKRHGLAFLAFLCGIPLVLTVTLRPKGRINPISVVTNIPIIYSIGCCIAPFFYNPFS